ncbi:type II secretion system F family protein [Alpinimonas psychrophila]|uniref:Tight adherence protein B n=1 Tax=Alpinimonas psychrophila TaxID=748908 RepID=A0A7W3JTN7_9MICO|nr:type II secretion system F family protein [Alpinimonas psychrophila]MBA8829041.1 tight adherence protein B [Alpinimonas psychrophila]
MRFDGLPALALLLGCALGAGTLLVLSVWAWPRHNPAGAAVARPLANRHPNRVTVLGISLLIGVIVGFLTFALSGVIGLSVIFAVASASAPRLVMRRQAHKERLLMRTLWPDVVDSLVSALRAGASLPAALSSLTTLSPRVVHHAAGEFERQYRLSGNFDACVDVLKTTWADPAADRILETLRLARHVGGSEVTTILRTLGGYLRQESAIRQEVEARQGWIRSAARIGVAAPWVVLALLATRPEAAAAYNSPAGITVIFIGFGLSLVAYRIMLAVAILPQPRRWFA